MITQIYEVNSPDEASKLAELGVDNIGVLVGKGQFPRELDAEEAKKVFEAVSNRVKKVALSLNWDLDEITELVEETKPDILHLGTLPERLSPNDVKSLKSKFPKLEIMRTIPVIDEESIGLAKEYDGIADYLLLDSHKKDDNQVGATGKTHNWEISKKIVESVTVPVILAGGLGPDNVAEAIQKVRPMGVDSKTKTDTPDGKHKDLEKVKKFVEIAKATQA
jgi:phosphoribosylanthranilate isomerase